MKDIHLNTGKKFVVGFLAGAAICSLAAAGIIIVCYLPIAYSVGFWVVMFCTFLGYLHSMGA